MKNPFELFDTERAYNQQEIRELAEQLKEKYPSSFVSFSENYSVSKGHKQGRLRIIEKAYNVGDRGFPATLFEFNSVSGKDIGEYTYKLTELANYTYHQSNKKS